MLSFSKFEHTNYTKSPFTYTEPLSCDYKVTVNGTQIPVYTCRISQNPINSCLEGVTHYNIRVSGISVNNVAICEDNAVLNIRNVENFTLQAGDFSQMKKNTVDPQNQLYTRNRVNILNPAGKGIRVLFAGNSITRHGPKEEIGWYGDYGMAASCEENDYVHVMMAAIREKTTYSHIPAALKGPGIAFIITGLMGIAFMIFSGIQL